MKYQKIWLIESTPNNDASFKSKVVYARVNMGKENNENMQGQGQQQSPSQWTQMIGQALENVTGKNMSTTLEFQDLEIDIPKAQGPDGRDLGSAKWTLNGKVVWTTELHKTGEIDGRGASISKGVMSDESTPGVSASFSCDFCNKGFSSREELKQHTGQEHSR
jgi:hypothetical protein